MKCYDFWAKFSYLNHVAKMNLTSSASLQYTLALALAASASTGIYCLDSSTLKTLPVISGTFNNSDWDILLLAHLPPNN